jgi:2-dehydro-3-deoxygluconokinase
VGRIVCFGEIMLRLSPPGRELLLQTPRLEVWIAGAEANVATALARLGRCAAMVSALPDNALGAAAIASLRGHGVDCGDILRREGRMATYYVVPGSGLRRGEVIYDRSGSSFLLTPLQDWDWPRLLAGADRLHLSGVTPALGPQGAQAALASAETANGLGVPVSFDGNYRSRLWSAWDSDPPAILRRLIACADILFGDERDVGLVLGRDFAGPDSRRAASDAAFAAFPRLRLIARTRRSGEGAERQTISARLDCRDDAAVIDELVLTAVVDRVGTGDAFAAGVLDAIHEGLSLGDAARAGLALAALKHSIPGDASLFGREDVAAVLEGGFDIRR